MYPQKICGLWAAAYTPASQIFCRHCFSRDDRRGLLWSLWKWASKNFRMTPLRYTFQSWKYTRLVAFSWPYFVTRNESFRYRKSKIYWLYKNNFYCYGHKSDAMTVMNNQIMASRSWLVLIWNKKTLPISDMRPENFEKTYNCHMLDNYRFRNVHHSQLNHFSIWRVFQSYFVLCCLPYDPHLYSPFYADLAASLSM